MHFKLWCDAGSKGNPGYCYGSYLIVHESTHFRQERNRIRLLDHGTNNQAEYLILIKALEQFRPDPSGDSLIVFTDSKLVRQQLMGNWKVRVAHVKELHTEAERLLQKWYSWAVEWVPRKQMVKRFGH